MMLVDSFIRFKDENGDVVYGEPTTSLSQPLEGTEATRLNGDPFNGFSKSNQKVKIVELLCPLESTPIVLCVGLNYQHHANEAKLPVPKYPATFTKPTDAMTGPSTITIERDVQDQLDYEGELTVVIGKTAKNVSESEALDYVLGYTNGNDLSNRYFQVPDNSGGQFCYAKSFDNFAPIGPAIVSASLIPDPQLLHYQTKVNGEVRQSTGTDDMIFSVAKIISHFSRATTLRAGTVIMTGTPSGVGFFMNPKGFLKDGDEVTVECEKLGVLRNKVVFEK